MRYYIASATPTGSQARLPVPLQVKYPMPRLAAENRRPPHPPYIRYLSCSCDVAIVSRNYCCAGSTSVESALSWVENLSFRPTELSSNVLPALQESGAFLPTSPGFTGRRYHRGHGKRIEKETSGRPTSVAGYHTPWSRPHTLLSHPRLPGRAVFTLRSNY